MNQDNENFEPLCRLLAFKRHEIPPPGYFNDFSRQVIARIKAGERSDELGIVERFLWEAPWLQRVWAALEAKPILAGACSVAVCGLLIAGVIYSDKADVPPVGLVPVADAAPAPVAPTTLAAVEHPLFLQPVNLSETSSTSPIPLAPAGGPLLGGIGQLRAQPASFTFPGGN